VIDLRRPGRDFLGCENPNTVAQHLDGVAEIEGEAG
jgi:hypothetical protein